MPRGTRVKITNSTGCDVVLLTTRLGDNSLSEIFRVKNGNHIFARADHDTVVGGSTAVVYTPDGADKWRMATVLDANNYATSAARFRVLRTCLSGAYNRREYAEEENEFVYPMSEGDKVRHAKFGTDVTVTMPLGSKKFIEFEVVLNRIASAVVESTSWPLVIHDRDITSTAENPEVHLDLSG